MNTQCETGKEANAGSVVKIARRKLAGKATPETPLPDVVERAILEASKNLNAGVVSAPVDFEKYKTFIE